MKRRIPEDRQMALGTAVQIASNYNTREQSPSFLYNQMHCECSGRIKSQERLESAKRIKQIVSGGLLLVAMAVISVTVTITMCPEILSGYKAHPVNSTADLGLIYNITKTMRVDQVLLLHPSPR